MRLFIAVLIPEEVKDRLEEKVRLLRKRLPGDLKWVERENWHLTLKFLGETGEDRIPEIREAISSLAAANQEGEISFKGITPFPRLSYPRVIVSTVDRGAAAVKKLHLELEEKLRESGFKKERRAFSPHLTLARSRRNTDLNALSTSLQKLDLAVEIPSTMKTIALIKSELRRTGPVYNELAVSRLRG